MSEFNNRIAAQRDILLLINSASWQEELYGLSSGAIERWINENKIERQSALIQLIKEAASKLFFLSNKSQEQITDEYKELSKEVQSLTKRIEHEVMNSRVKGDATLLLKAKTGSVLLAIDNFNKIPFKTR